MVPVKDKVEYIIALINEFAKRFKLTDVQAYRYRRKCGYSKLSRRRLLSRIPNPKN